MPNRRRFSQSEYRMAGNIGLSAGQVSFGSLFASLFAPEKTGLLGTISLLLTFIFWGSSLLLARRFKI